MSGRGALAVGLGLSILLNLFLAGVIVGRLSMPAFLQYAPPKAGLVPRGEIQKLPLSEKRAFAVIFRRHIEELRGDREKVRAAKLAVEDAIGAPKLDPKLLDARLAALRDAQFALSIASHRAIEDALPALSAQSRATIARHVQDRTQSEP